MTQVPNPGGAAAWFLAVVLSLGPGSACVGAPRNILLIIADDYGADSSSLYNSTANGASLPPTPHIESLARSGVVFRNGYANPVCSPTRACLITGRHGFRTGVGDVVTGPTSPALRASELTLPEAFAANASLGYQLAQFGKWHLHNGPNSPATIGGWPQYAGGLSGALASFTNWTKTVNGTSTANYTNYATTDVVDDASAWIQAQGAQPWFAWVAFNAGHTPLHKPPNDLHSYDSLSGTQANINNNPRPYFEAMIEAMDTEIGRLLAAADRANTHIIFLGDNGSTANQLQPPYPSGRGKGTLYQGGTRVPFIVAGPAVANPGRTNDTLVHAVDLFATILELAGIDAANTVPANVTVDSRSLVPVLAGGWNGTRRCYTELFGEAILNSQDGRALRDERYKLIRFNDGRDEFYDLQSDPYEGTNLLAGTLTTSQQQHRDRLEFWLAGYSTNAGPRILAASFVGGQFTVSVAQTEGATHALWRCDDPAAAFWSPVHGAVVGMTNSMVTLADPSPPAARAFYSVVQSP